MVTTPVLWKLIGRRMKMRPRSCFKNDEQNMLTTEIIYWGIPSARTDSKCSVDQTNPNLLYHVIQG